MLQSMRDLSKTYVFKGLMALLIVSFGIWGVGDMFRSRPNQREVARVGQAKILAQELLLQFQISLGKARQSLGPDLTAAQAKRIGVLDQTLSLMMEQSSFDQEAERLGLNMNARTVFKRIASLPELRGKDGRFNVARWQDIVRRSGLSEQTLLNSEKAEIQREMIFRAVTANAQAPQTMVDNMYKALGARRLLEVVSLRADAFKNVPAPDEAAMKAFYAAHEDSFLAPEYRGVTVAVMQGEDLAKEVVLSEDDLRKAYETRGDDLTLPETRDLLQIVFQDEAKAKAFRDSLKGAGSFAATAKAKGLTPVEMPKMDEKTILPELYTGVFALGEGEVSDPLQSPLGWHVVGVKTIHKGGKPSFDQVKDELRQTLRDERLGDLVAKQVNQLDDSIAGGKTLEDIADALKLRLVRFAALDAGGKGMDGKPVKDIPLQKDILRAAFELGAGETGQVLDDHQGRYYVVRTDQVTPSRTLSFEEVEPKVKAALVAELQAAAAAQEAEKIAQSLREGGRATSFAARAGVEVRLSKPLSMLGDTDKELPPVALAQIFKMKKGDVITAPGGDKAFVLRLTEIVPVDVQKPEAAKMKVEDELRRTLPADYLDQYAKHLHAIFPQKINASEMDRLRHQDDGMGR